MFSKTGQSYCHVFYIKSKMNKNFKYFILFFFIFILDRITKLAALMYFKAPFFINQYLSLELVFNRGVSWGMFHDTSQALFILVSGIIFFITLFLCWHAYVLYKKGISIIGHICIIAGSSSNLIDRIVYGGVIDFIILSYGAYSWPVFNIADMAIVCGVGLLIALNDT